MNKVYSIISGKGGVGKTFFSINISATAAYYQKKVLLIDANLTTPNVSICLGFYDYKNTIHHVLKGKCKPKDAIYKTKYGFDIMPASLSVYDLIGVDPDKLTNIVEPLKDEYEYIFIDCSASLGRETIGAMEASKKCIIITIPENTAIVDAYKAVKVAEYLDVDIGGIILNKYKKDIEISIKFLESYLGKKIIGIIPEDPIAPKLLKNKEVIIKYKGHPVYKAFVSIYEYLEGITTELNEDISLLEHTKSKLKKENNKLDFFSKIIKNIKQLLKI